MFLVSLLHRWCREAATPAASKTHVVVSPLAAVLTSTSSAFICLLLLLLLAPPLLLPVDHYTNRLYLRQVDSNTLLASICMSFALVSVYSSLVFVQTRLQAGNPGVLSLLYYDYEAFFTGHEQVPQAAAAEV